MRVTISHKAHFNALYTTHNPNWSAQVNHEVFGTQDSPAYKGHNYNFTVRLTGEMNPRTGEVFSFAKLKQLVKDKVEERFDHKNLYLDLNDFNHTVPTPPRMAMRIWEILRQEIPATIDLHVTVEANNEQSAEFSGELVRK